jgi:hypothetical protein
MGLHCLNPIHSRQDSLDGDQPVALDRAVTLAYSGGKQK